MEIPFNTIRKGGRDLNYWGNPEKNYEQVLMNRIERGFEANRRDWTETFLPPLAQRHKNLLTKWQFSCLEPFWIGTVVPPTKPPSKEGATFLQGLVLFCKATCGGPASLDPNSGDYSRKITIQWVSAGKRQGVTQLALGGLQKDKV